MAGMVVVGASVSGGEVSGVVSKVSGEVSATVDAADVPRSAVSDLLSFFEVEAKMTAAIATMTATAAMNQGNLLGRLGVAPVVGPPTGGAGN